jgi:hypothetical protein
MADPYKPLREGEHLAFNEAIGEAIQRWSGVETALFQVFEIVSTCGNRTVAQAIFYAPQNFSEKLKITHSATRIYFTFASLAEWSLLRGRCDRANTTRNNLVHFYLRDTIHAVNDSPYSLSLHPNFWNPNEKYRRSERPRDEQFYDLPRIRKAIDIFGTLALDVSAFAHSLKKNKKRTAPS